MTIPEIYLDEVDSTMVHARRLVPGIGDDIFRVRAGHQTAGRGRRSRRWHDIPGEALMMTVGVRRNGVFDPGDSNPGVIALRTGAALAEAVAKFLPEGPLPEIKWPNDLLLDDRKLAGVLVEADSRWFFIGVGVNLYFREAARTITGHWAPDTADLQPVSLREFCEIEDDAVLLAAVDTALLRHLRGNAWRDVVARRLAWRGLPVSVEAAEGAGTEGAGAPVTGVIAGVGDDGALLLEGTNETLSVYAGTVRLQSQL